MNCQYWVNQGMGGKTKRGRSEGWPCMKSNGGGFQSDGSSWARRMIVMRTKVSGKWLFYNLSICFLSVWLRG